MGHGFEKEQGVVNGRVWMVEREGKSGVNTL